MHHYMIEVDPPGLAEILALLSDFHTLHRMEIRTTDEPELVIDIWYTCQMDTEITDIIDEVGSSALVYSVPC